MKKLFLTMMLSMLILSACKQAEEPVNTANETDKTSEAELEKNEPNLEKTSDPKFDFELQL